MGYSRVLPGAQHACTIAYAEKSLQVSRVEFANAGGDARRARIVFCRVKSVDSGFAVRAAVTAAAAA